MFIFFKHVHDPCFRVDVVQTACDEEGVVRGCALGACNTALFSDHRLSLITKTDTHANRSTEGAEVHGEQGELQ